MRKGYYYFRECTSLQIWLLSLGTVSFILCLIFLFKGGYLSLISNNYYFNTENVWFLFFLILSIFLFVIDICINKICRDIATFLKEIEDKSN